MKLWRPGTAGGQLHDLSRETSFFQLFAEEGRRSPKNGERSPVHRYDTRDSQQLAGLGGLAGSHRVEVADGEKGQVRRVQLSDQGHVGEDVSVTGMIEPEAVLERHDIAARVGGKVRFSSRPGSTRRVDCLNHSELDAGDRLAPALVHARDLLDAARAAVEGQLEDRDDRRAGFLRERDAVVSEVVEVTVCRGNDVEAVQVEPLRELRIVPDPGIDRDADTLG